ncbi:MAG TPA: kelch repeat-containing protein [Verrucomicrobiae bacterium]|nr:kelch repeat-containing protein [Verrucomicrobiae bacterium]
MYATLAAVTCRRIGSLKKRRAQMQAGLILLAAILSLAPARAFAAVSVTISPSSVNLPTNGSQQFAATVTGASDTSVTWTILEGAAGGTISGSGLYLAPGAVGVYHVIATSNADPTQSATAAVALPGFVQTGLLNPDPCTATLLTNGTVLYTGGGIPSAGSSSSQAEIYNPASSTSTPTGSMVIGRCSETATLLQNGKVLFAGGQASGGATASAELYDPLAGTFTATGSMSVARSGHAATLLSSGQVLIAGGENCSSSCVDFNTAELYDPNSGTFSPTTGNLATPYVGAAAILLNNGKVLVAGGSTDGATLNSFAELYDPTTGLFTQSGAMVHPRSSFTATLLQNGNVLIAGGAAGATELPAAEIYNPSTGTFASTGSLNLSRQFHTASLLLNGKVLIAGGNSSPNTAELYDPESGTFSLTGNLGETRWSPTATALPNGMVLIAGGFFVQFLSSIETYDPSAGVFTSQSVFMNVPRTGHATTPLADGRLLLTGGENATFQVNSSAEIFDPATSRFSITGSMSQGRVGHTATLLSDGNVLIVGGGSPTAELFNPTTGTFSPTSSNPNLARTYHTATLLRNGKVLIAGGQIPGQQDTSTVELYDPTAETFTLAGNMSGPRYNHTATLLNDGRVLIADGITQAGSPGNGVGPDDVYDPSTGLFTQVGLRSLIEQQTISPFDSVLLADGRVLADSQTIFDPILNTLSTISSLVNLDAILQDYKFALLPNGQVFATSNFYPTYLFDPASETYTASASVQYYRSSPTLKLLANGEVLVAGGASVTQVEFYVPPVAASNSAPVLSGISPSSAVAGGAGFTLLVVGSNFLSNSVVNYNGVARQTTFLNAQQLTIAISSGDIANPGTATITVTNPASGAGGNETTNPVTLTILAANVQPVVGALSPASATAGGPSFTLTLTGNNFTTNSIVTFGGSQLTPTFLSVTELQVNIPASAIAVAGTPLVTVANSGGNPSVAVSFTVNNPVNPVPAATSISPSSVPAGSAALTLAVTGANFVQGSTVQVNGNPRTTTFVSPTSLTAALPLSDFSHTGMLNVTVNNPNPGGGTTSPLLLSVVADFNVSATSQSATVPAGQTANFSLMLAPAKGQLTLNGAVTFSTSPLPPGAQATFTPTNVPAGSAGTNVMLAIATTPHSSGSFVLVTFGEWPYAPLLLGAELAIGMMWFALGALRGSARRLAPLLLILLLLAVASGLTACGISGGGGGSSGPQVNTGTGTPAGNYMITVNAMSGNTTVPTTVTLTVK